ncbi:hypothetical protein DM02DRAFT_618281 [Periconia macrospinosa]|uniref:Uncharacterized protein n=1 Tax=Periconia macrospinosa TaxID=97972 RepID=A0A2V1D9Y8_9PLEO|nr:hypothetical protein DM02DRAFT_618281 [Periconia macrospinosa]
MVSIHDLSYSREATVAAIRDYYRFLVSMYMDESNVLEPPAGGWPSIPPHGWANFGKTDEVMGLLRELPYLDQCSEPYQIHAAPYTVFADWQNTEENCDGQKLKKWTEPWPDEIQCEIPAHIVGLTAYNDPSPAILLDTELGVIYWYECSGKLEENDETEGVQGDPYAWEEDGLIPEDQVEWRGACGIWSIENFFKMLKEQFRKLNFVPIGPREVQDVWVGQADELKETQVAVQNIYRKHGWPDMARFNREACRAEVKLAIRPWQN